MSRTSNLSELIDHGSTYLVTGGGGFIGSNLARVLIASGVCVRILDDFSTGNRSNLDGVEEDFELIEGTITNPAVCRRACEDVDIVLHQAALPSVLRSVDEPVPTHEVDASGTLNMLIAARDAGVRRFVYAASSSAYGDTDRLPKVESLPVRPRSPYAAAKLAGEHYCAAFTATYDDFAAVALRYFNVFGPRQDPTSQYSAVIPVFIDCALNRRRPTIHGDGEQTRDFTYVENVVRANLMAAVAPETGVAGEVFNVGCGERVSVNELWSVIREIVGCDVEADHGPPRPGDVRHSLAGLDKIRQRTGYEPIVGLKEGLSRTVEWFRS